MKVSRKRPSGQEGLNPVEDSNVIYTGIGSMEGFKPYDPPPPVSQPAPVDKDENGGQRHSIRDLLYDFSQGTSLHGVSKVGSPDRPIIVRLFWFLLVLTAGVWAGYNVILVIENFRSYPVSTVVSVEYEDNLEFPAVTICNLNQIRNTDFQREICELVYGKAYCEYAYGNGTYPYDSGTSGDGTFPYGSSTLIGGPFASTSTSTTTPTTSTTSATGSTSSGSYNYFDFNSNYDTWGSGDSVNYYYDYDYYDVRNNLRFFLDQYDPDKRHMVGHKLMTMLVECKYQGIDCSPRNFTHFWNHRYGNCYIFNKDQRAKAVSRPGSKYGLTLLLNAEEGEYSKDTDVVGFKIVVHHHQDMPFPEDEGLTVSPGFSTSIAISKMDIYRAEAPYGRCHEYSEEENRKLNMYADEFNVAYTDKACQRTCYQSSMVERCQCCDGDYPCKVESTLGKITVCNASVIGLQQCIKEVRKDFEQGTIGCGEVCLPSCVETIYSTEVSMGTWPSSASLYQLQRQLTNLPKQRYYWDTDEAFLRKNVAKVQIFFKQLNYEKIETYPAYDWSRVLADLGGQLGLWLGFSLLTGVEIAELLLSTFRRLLIKIFCPKPIAKVNAATVQVSEKC